MPFGSSNDSIIIPAKTGTPFGSPNDSVIIPAKTGTSNFVSPTTPTQQSTYNPTTGIATTLTPSGDVKDEQVATIPTATESFWDKVGDFLKKGLGSPFMPYGALAEKALPPSYSERQAEVNKLPGTETRDQGAEERSKAFYGKTDNPSREKPEKEPDLLDLVKTSVDAERSFPTMFGDQVDKAVLDRAKDLGLSLQYDNSGKPSLVQTGTPTIKPEEIAKISNNISNSFTRQIQNLQGELKDLPGETAINENLAIAKTLDQPDLASQPYISQKSQRDQKQGELSALLEKQQEVSNLYNGLYSTMKQAGHQAAAQIALEGLQPGASYTETAQKLNDDTKLRTQNLGTGLETYHMLNGADVSNVGSISDQITAKYDVLNQTANAPLERSVSPETLQKYLFVSASGDISSLKQTVDRDNQILDKVNSEMRLIRAQGVKKNIPTDQVEDYITKTGLRDYYYALQNNIDARKQEITYDQNLIDTKTPDYKRFMAQQQLLTKQYNDSPVAKALGTDIATAIPKLRDNIASWDVTLRTLLGSKSVSEQDNKSVIYRATHDLELSKLEPQFLDDNGFLRNISQKEAVVFGNPKAPLVPTNFNFDAAVYQTSNMVTSMLPWLATGAFIEKNIVSPAFSSLLSGLKAGETASQAAVAGTALGEAAASTNNLYKVGRLATQYAIKPIVGASLEFGLPGLMTMSSPEGINREMQKGLTFEQAVQVNAFRTYWESMAMAVAPVQMDAFRKAFVGGELKNMAEETVYRDLMETNWQRFTSRSMSDGFYNLVFNTVPAIGKQYLIDVGAISVQQDLALGMNALTDLYLQGKTNNTYQSEYEVTAQHLLNNTLTAMATMLPLAVLHGYKVNQLVRDAQYSSLYIVANSPEQYSAHIQSRLDKGEIDRVGALRQVKIIQQVDGINKGLKGEYDQIDATPALEDNKKAQLKFELFKNKIEQAGLSDAITELTSKAGFDITKKGDEKALKDLEGYLNQNAESYEQIKAFREAFEKATPEQREDYRVSKVVTQLSKEFSIYNLDLKSKVTRGGGLQMTAPQMESAKALIEDLKTRLAEEANPKLQEVYTKMIDRVDLALAHNEFQKGISGDRMQAQVERFADVLEKERANPDSKVYKDGKIVKDNLDVNQRFIVEKYPTLLKAELDSRGLDSDWVKPEEVKKEEPASNLVDEKERINSITDIEELNKERDQAFRNKNLTKEEQRELYNHIGDRREELINKAKEVKFGETTYHHNDFVRVAGHEGLFRVQKVDEDGRLVVRIGEDDEALDKAVEKLNAARTKDIAKSKTDEEKKAINEKFSKDLAKLTKKSEVRVSDPADVTTVTQEEVNKHFADKAEQARLKKVKEKESIANQTSEALALIDSGPAKAEGKTIEILNDKDQPITLKFLKGISDKDFLVSVKDPEGVWSEPVTYTKEELERRINERLEASLGTPKSERISNQSAPKDLSTMTKPELEAERDRIKQVLDTGLSNPDLTDKEYTDLADRVTEIEKLLKPTSTKTPEQEAKEKEEQLVKDANLHSSRVINWASTAPQEVTKGGVDTSPVVQAQVATFKALRQEHLDSGKTYTQMGYFATVMNNNFPVDERHQNTSVIEDFKKESLSEDKIKAGRIAVLTDGKGEVKYFNQDGTPGTKETGYPVYQNLRGRIKDGELVVDPSKEFSVEYLKETGQLIAYLDNKEKLKRARLSTEPLTFEIAEITQGVMGKPEFTTINLGADSEVEFQSFSSGQLTVKDLKTGELLRSKKSMTVGESDLKADILAMLDMNNKEGLPEQLKHSFTNRAGGPNNNTGYLEKYIYTNAKASFRIVNGKPVVWDRLAKKPSSITPEQMLLNIDAETFLNGKPTTWYHWNGSKFIPQELDYKTYAADHWKFYKAEPKTTDSYLKLGDPKVAEVKPIEKKGQPEEEIKPDTITKTSVGGEFTIRKKRERAPGSGKKGLRGDKGKPTTECNG